jgi:hypothetical protein
LFLFVSSDSDLLKKHDVILIARTKKK